MGNFNKNELMAFFKKSNNMKSIHKAYESAEEIISSLSGHRETLRVAVFL